MRKLIAVLSLLFPLLSCTVKPSEDSSIDHDLAALEAAVTSIDSIIDTVSPNTFTGRCPRIFEQTCKSAGLVLNMDGCELVDGQQYLGQVRLAFEGENCALDIDESVLRTHETVLQNLRGGVLHSKGKSTLTRISVASWRLEMREIEKSLHRKGEQTTSFSIATDEAVEVRGMLSRDLRVVEGGVIFVRNNNRGADLAFRPHLLRYSARCCHPVSGRMEIAASNGAHSEVEFQGCGQGTLVRGEEQIPVTLTYCE